MQKLKREDEVIVIAGKDKGTRGKITRVQDDGRLIISGINMVKRHTKPNPNMGQQGGIIEKEASIHVSNVAHVDPDTGDATRVGFKLMEDGRKVRYAKRSGEVIDR